MNKYYHKLVYRSQPFESIQYLRNLYIFIILLNILEMAQICIFNYVNLNDYDVTTVIYLIFKKKILFIMNIHICIVSLAKIKNNFKNIFKNNFNN